MTRLEQALDRTLLLMRDEFRPDVPDAFLVEALISTSVALVADAETLSSSTAQTAFVTAAMLCARSGHHVYLVAPDVPLAGIQPPLHRGGIISALVQADGQLIPANCFATSAPPHVADVEIRFGSTPPLCSCRASYFLTADSWNARLERRGPGKPWDRFCSWPMGAMAGAVLAATEVFKFALRKLRRFANSRNVFDTFIAPNDGTPFQLAPTGAPQPSDLGSFDIVSGGAITNGALYALSRLPNVRGSARVLEPDVAEISNLNRYMLLLFDQLERSKATQLAAVDFGGLSVQPFPIRYEDCKSIELADRVLVGVDHIPTRWNVQKANPKWLGIGATTHWSAMASFHTRGLPCAGCLHPTDDPTDGPIPTVAFVSFMAGLMQAAYFVREVGGETPIDQQNYVTVLRPETPWRTPISFRADCPVGHVRQAA